LKHQLDDAICFQFGIETNDFGCGCNSDPKDRITKDGFHDWIGGFAQLSAVVPA
jgi:hypothetical protein